MPVNRAITSPVKSIRFDIEKLIYHISWAFMRKQCTHNRMKIIFSEDPYAEVYTIHDNIYAIFEKKNDGIIDINSVSLLNMPDTIDAIVENSRNYDYAETGLRNITFFKNVKRLHWLSDGRSVNGWQKPKKLVLT